MTGDANALLVDGHVHFHDCFDATAFLDGAARNFAAAAKELGLPAQTRGCLMFTESAWDQAFRVFRDEPTRLSLREWKLERTEEDASLLAHHPSGARLVLIAGRQVVTREGLEVLALGRDGEFPEGRSTAEALEIVRTSGALPGIPWGFGKWWLRRGRLVAEILERDGDFFLGDTGGRPRLAREHPLFERARRKGIPILPGSDPLPFPDQSTTAGSYGFSLPGPLDESRPARSTIAALRRMGASPSRFGRREGAMAFCRHQLAMQLRNCGIGGAR